MGTVKKLKAGWFKFWIRSSRGTNQVGYIQTEEAKTKEEIKELCEDWCSQFGAWTASENHIEYGWEKVKTSEVPKELLEKATKEVPTDLRFATKVVKFYEWCKEHKSGLPPTVRELLEEVEKE